jgi:hypothetical protein
MTSKPTRPVVINVSMTNYRIISKAAYYAPLGWKVSTSDAETPWDVLWVDSLITE